MLSLYEILKASKTGIAPDMWTALAGMNWGGADSGHEVKELTGIPPLSFTADGTPLLDYLISGNTVQNGTPTPDNPVDVNGVGERTENLFDINSTATTFNCLVSVNDNALTQTNSGIYARSIWKVDNLVIGAKYTVHVTANNPNSCSFRLNVMDSTDSTVIASGNTYTDSRSYFISFTATETTHIIRIYSNTTTTGSTSTIVFSNIMLNAGSTALPYEPYGYKIPISSDDVTTNIYLGSTQTTRCVKKLVLTGQENWGSSHLDVNLFALSGIDDTAKGLEKTTISTHYQSQTNVESWNLVIDKRVCFHAYSNSNILYIRDSTYATVADFTTYLSQQYANGTPVTVWYGLAAPTTGIVNEPLMKIGDYADSVGMEQAGVQIPTLHGNTVIDVETTIKPSEMYIKYQK